MNRSCLSSRCRDPGKPGGAGRRAKSRRRERPPAAAGGHSRACPGRLAPKSSQAPQKNTPGAVYYDITWTGVIGTPTDRQVEIFNVVTGGRDAGVKKVQEAYAGKRRIAGWEVDQATREFITTAGYGEFFVHRTGHNIGSRVHGNGAHLDNLETHDTRPLLANTCTSMEPGIYLPDEGLGLRTEVDILLLPNGIEVTGEPRQNEVIALLA